MRLVCTLCLNTCFCCCWICSCCSFDDWFRCWTHRWFFSMQLGLASTLSLTKQRLGWRLWLEVRANLRKDSPKVFKICQKWHLPWLDRNMYTCTRTFVHERYHWIQGYRYQLCIYIFMYRIADSLLQFLRVSFRSLQISGRAFLSRSNFHRHGELLLYFLSCRAHHQAGFICAAWLAYEFRACCMSGLRNEFAMVQSTRNRFGLFKKTIYVVKDVWFLADLFLVALMTLGWKTNKASCNCCLSFEFLVACYI